MEELYNKLEFDQILKHIENHASSSLGKQKISEIHLIQDNDLLQSELSFNEEGLRLIHAHGDLPMGGFLDIYPSLHKVSIGGVLTIEELMAIEGHIYTTKNIVNYKKGIKVEATRFVSMVEQIQIFSQLQEEIQKCIDDRGEVSDLASTQLSLIRREYKVTEKSIKQKLEHFMNGQRDHMAESFVTQRHNRYVIPVKSSSKSIIKGMIHGESSSGQTIFMEPTLVIDLNNQLQSLKARETKEIERILAALSLKVNEVWPDLEHNTHIISELDALYAKAKYAKELNCIIPMVVEGDFNLSIKKARHPLIDKQKVVANDILLLDPHQMMLITGSNTGGKTVTLKTIGLLCMMSLSGLAIPASKAQIPLFETIFVDLGDGQSIAESLSTYSSHMKRIIEITEHVTNRSLVLLDELGSGTDPKDGENLAISILDFLYHKKAMVVATTHYSKLKMYARQHSYVLGASVAFNLDTLTPTYELILNQLGKSYALEIASRLGLNSQIIDQARLYASEDQDQYELLIEQLESELESNRKLRLSLESQMIESNNQMEAYQKMQEQLEMDKVFIMNKAKEDANVLVVQAKKEAETIIEALKKQNQLKLHEQNAIMQQLDQLQTKKDVETGDENFEYQVGDLVKVISVQRIGEVVRVMPPDNLEISMGGLKMRLKKSEVIFSSKKKKEVISHRTKVAKPNVKHELNLIGLRQEEAIALLDPYIYQAVLAGLPTVRIIHGHGTGALRKAVHQYLSKNKRVESFRLGDGYEGGVGATVVQLK